MQLLPRHTFDFSAVEEIEEIRSVAN